MAAFITIIRQFGREPDQETLEISVADPRSAVDPLEMEVHLQVVAILHMDSREFPILRAVCEELGVWRAAEENGEATSPDELAAKILHGFTVITEGNVPRRRKKFHQKICDTVHRNRHQQV